jgi:hypothetical protein
MVTLGESNDLNVQVWNGSSWSKTSLSTAFTTSSRNGIGIAYE